MLKSIEPLLFKQVASNEATDNSGPWFSVTVVESFIVQPEASTTVT